MGKISLPWIFGGAAAALFLWLVLTGRLSAKGNSEVAELAEQLMKNDPSLTQLEATALAAATIAQQAVTTAQNASVAASSDQNAAAAVAAEGNNTVAQTAASSNPTDPTAAQAAAQAAA